MKLIKKILKEAIDTLGLILVAGFVVTTIVLATDLIAIANKNRPSFAVGGEWLLIMFMFLATVYVFDSLLNKRKPLKNEKPLDMASIPLINFDGNRGQ